MDDPYELAERMGLSIDYAWLGPGIDGLYTGSQILLTPRLGWRDERCTLGHELGHAVFDEPFIHRRLSGRAERRADRFAAELLIDPVLFADYSRYLDAGELAIELGVTGWCLQAWLRVHPEMRYGLGEAA